MLYPSLAYVSSKKQGCKGYTVQSCSPGRVKVILTLLAEHITLHVQAARVHLGKTCFKRFFPEAIVLSHSGLILGMFLTLTEQTQSKLGGSLKVFVRIPNYLDIWGRGRTRSESGSGIQSGSAREDQQGKRRATALAKGYQGPPSSSSSSHAMGRGFRQGAQQRQEPGAIASKLAS